MRVLRLSFVIFTLAVCMGVGKADKKLCVLPSWEDLPAGREGKTLARVFRKEDLKGPEPRSIAEEITYGSARTFGEEDDDR